MRYRFFLDGLEMPSPMGWRDATLSFVEDKELKGLFVTITGEVTWIGEACQYIRSVRDTQGFCATIVLRVEYSTAAQYAEGQNWKTFYDGKIFISNMKFEPCKCKVIGDMTNDSSEAYLTTGKNIKALCGQAATSKDGITIDVFTSLVGFFDQAGAYQPGYANRTCILVFNAFKYMLNYITNNVIDFKSDYFGPGGEGYTYVIATGRELREGIGDFPNISFLELFREMDKRFNLRMGIEKDKTGAIFLRVEPLAYWEQSDVLITVDVETEDTTPIESYFTELLYSQVEIGNSNTADGFLFPNIPLKSFAGEDYNVTGTCNIDNTLDLNMDWINDANTIQAALAGDDSFDKNIFVVQTDIAIALAAQWIAPFGMEVSPGLPLNAYNETLTNEAILVRQLGGIPKNIIKYYGTGSDLCEAQLTSDQIFVAANGIGIPGSIYDNEISDPNGRYDTANGRYTIPLDGVYTFDLQAKLDVSVGATTILLKIFRKDSTGSLLRTFSDPLFTSVGIGTTTLSYVSPGFYAGKGDRIEFEIHSTAITSPTVVVKADPATRFKCIEFENGTGGIGEDYDPTLIKIIKHEFSTGLKLKHWIPLLKDRRKRIAFSYHGRDYEANIKSMKMSIGSFKTDLVLKRDEAT